MTCGEPWQSNPGARELVGGKIEHQLGELTDGGCLGQPELLRQMTSIAHGFCLEQLASC